MSLVSDIIRDAYRESNINAIGVSPTDAQKDEALRLLNRILLSVYGNEEGDQLQPFPLGRNNVERPQDWPWYDQNPLNDWFVPLNVRLMLNLEEPQSLYLHPQPQDGARVGLIDKSGNIATNVVTIYGNGRTILGAETLTLNVNGTNVEYLYRDDLGDWLKVTPLEYDDTWPFPMEFDDFFVVGLAMRINPRNGAAVDAQSVEAYKRGLGQFRARYHQMVPMRSELGLIRTPGTWPNRYFGGSYGTDLFNAGYPYPPDFMPWGS